MYRFLKPLLFLLPPEAAHAVATAFLWLWSRLFPRPRRRAPLPLKLWDIEFPSPVGLAAGMDKGDVVAPAWFRLGFGWVEIGTITPRPQPGNPRPRLFRLPPFGALINRMGFNNPGAALVASRLARLPPQPGPICVNVGRNKETPNERAADDYVAAFRTLAPHAQLAAINVSSPNTPGLRELQSELGRLVGEVVKARDALPRRIPILVKLSPDEPDDRLVEMARSAESAGADGIIATNTTLARVEHPLSAEQGGLSGAPLRDRALHVCRLLYRSVRIPIVGVGGIGTAEDAYARIRAGASLIQIYTALIYDGPGTPRRITDGLAQLLKNDGLTLAQAIGIDARQVGRSELFSLVERATPEDVIVYLFTEEYRNPQPEETRRIVAHLESTLHSLPGLTQYARIALRHFVALSSGPYEAVMDWIRANAGDLRWALARGGPNPFRALEVLEIGANEEAHAHPDARVFVLNGSRVERA